MLQILYLQPICNSICHAPTIYQLVHYTRLVAGGRCCLLYTSMQTKQIVNTLMLDDATAAKFTPVYEKYLKELRECRDVYKRQ